jgi:hypothetical protein
MMASLGSGLSSGTTILGTVGVRQTEDIPIWTGEEQRPLGKRSVLSAGMAAEGANRLFAVRGTEMGSGAVAASVTRFNGTGAEMRCTSAAKLN